MEIKVHILCFIDDHKVVSEILFLFTDVRLFVKKYKKVRNILLNNVCRKSEVDNGFFYYLPNGKKHGLSRTCHQEFIDEIVYNNGKIKQFTTYYKSGKKYVERAYSKGKQNGQDITWNENGTIFRILNKKNNKKEGKCIEYYGNGKPYKISFYRNNDVDGKCKVFCEDGRLHQKHYYKFGYLLESKTYTFSGELFSHLFFMKGVIDGVCKRYHKNGTVKEECYYVNGKREGNYKFFHNNNQLKTCGFIKNGEDHPFPLEWDKNGRQRFIRR